MIAAAAALQAVPHVSPELGWTGAGAIVTAAVYSGIRWFVAKPRPAILARTTRGHFLDGIALFPMALLTVSPFVAGLAEALVQHDSGILAAAGGVAILAVLEPDRTVVREAKDAKDAAKG